MPSINIKMPDGSLKPHQVPEGTTDAQAKAIADQVRASAQPQAQEKPKESWPEYLKSALSNAGKGAYVNASEAGRGIRNLGQYVGFPEAKAPNYATDTPGGLTPEERKSTGFAVGGVAADLLPILAMGEFKLPAAAMETLSALPTITKYLPMALKNSIVQKTIPQALYSAATSNQNRSESGLATGATMAPMVALSEAISSRNPAVSKMARAMLSATMGPLLGYGGYEAGKAAGLPEGMAATLGGGAGLLGAGLGWRGIPSLRIPQEIAKEVEKYPGAAERIESSRRLDLPYITPLEATSSGRLAAKEGKLSVNPSESAADILVGKGEQRTAAEGRAIDKTLNIISNPELVEKKNKLYSKSYYTKEPPFANSIDIPVEFKQKYSRTVPEDIFGLKDNETFKDAEKLMLSEPEYKEAMKGVPRNSIEYLDNVKKVMGDKANELTRGSHSKGLIESTQNRLVKGLDEYAPNYKEARGLAERQIAKQEIVDYFDKRRTEGVPMAQFLKSKEGFEELQKHLRNIPEAQEQLKDMKLVFTNLLPSLTGTGTAKLYGTSMKESRSGGQFFSKILDNVLFSNDKIMADLITNPKWFEELERIKKITNAERRAGAFVGLVGKVGAQEAGKNVAQ